MSLDATRWVWQLQIVKGTDKFVLMALADRADERHCCYPSMSRIQYDTGLNIKTIQSAISRLRDAGLIQKTGRMMGQTKSTPEYQLIGVQGREDLFVKQKAKRAQKRSTPQSGVAPKTEHPQNYREAPPKLPRSSPKIG